MSSESMLLDWLLPKIDAVKDCRCVIVRDPLRLAPESGGKLHEFALANRYTVIMAGTNLVFRDLYEQARAEDPSLKLLLVDRARPQQGVKEMHAPAPFYPDLLAVTHPEARLEVSLHAFLRDQTGDTGWPVEIDNPRYARLVAHRLEDLLRAHANLRDAHPTRFTDSDLQTIVAYAALGAASSAFKKLAPADYFRIGLLGRKALEQIEALAPEVTRPIREALAHAPAPYSWLGAGDPDAVVRALYLSAIMAQHLPDRWAPLISRLDPSIRLPLDADGQAFLEAARELWGMDPSRGPADLQSAEDSLDGAALGALLIDQVKIDGTGNAITALERESFSSLVRSLALLLLIDARMSASPAPDQCARIRSSLSGDEPRPVDARPCDCWESLKEAWSLVDEVLNLRTRLTTELRDLGVRAASDRTFTYFWNLWNGKGLNRLEYSLSRLERLMDTAPLLPRKESDLPAPFPAARDRIRDRVRKLADEVRRQLDDLNRHFQNLVAARYPEWAASDGDVILTARFIQRCLKPHWDPKTERAAVLIFDGMRYDIWDRWLRPTLVESMDLVMDYPASSILPSETQLTRKAISAGAFPEDFKTTDAENQLLQAALDRDLGLLRTVEQAPADGSGIGETVHYCAQNLDVYIFELCDKELHKIKVKTLQDGRAVAARPLSLIYDQVIKSLIDIEVAAVVRRLEPGTKVFITADHGFGPVGRDPLWIKPDQLNDASDCAYLNCWLRAPLGASDLSRPVRDNVIAFTPAELRVRSEGTVRARAGAEVRKAYGDVLFPRTGHAFSRPNSRFDPDAYSHGGISLQEMLIPMVVLQVKPAEGDALVVDLDGGPSDVMEGQDVELTLRLRPTGGEEIPVTVEAAYARDPDRFPIPRQTVFVGPDGKTVPIRFRPGADDATDDERRAGQMERTLVVSAAWQRGGRTFRRSRSHRFTVRLRSDVIIRRVGSLGSILGLTPKGRL